MTFSGREAAWKEELDRQEVLFFEHDHIAHRAATDGLDRGRVGPAGPAPAQDRNPVKTVTARAHHLFGVLPAQGPVARGGQAVPQLFVDVTLLEQEAALPEVDLRRAALLVGQKVGITAPAQIEGGNQMSGG